MFIVHNRIKMYKGMNNSVEINFIDLVSKMALILIKHEKQRIFTLKNDQRYTFQSPATFCDQKFAFNHKYLYR